MSDDRQLRFDEALERAKGFIRQHQDLRRPETVLVRDLYGRIRIALDDRTADVPDASRRAKLAAELHSTLRAWSPGESSIFLVASRLFAPEEIFGTADALWANPAQRDYRVLDRSITGAPTGCVNPSRHHRPSAAV